MLQVSEWCDTPEELGFIVAQLRKTDGAVDVLKKKGGRFAIYRIDKEPIDHAARERAVYHDARHGA